MRKGSDKKDRAHMARSLEIHYSGPDVETKQPLSQKTLMRIREGLEKFFGKDLMTRKTRRPKGSP
jgi:hypothetical protein